MKSIRAFSIFNLKFSILLLSCIIISCSDNNTPKNQEVNFAEHISPIIFKNCTPCHRVGEAGPFALLNYSDAKKNANKIKFVTQTRYMPPWPADVNYTHFINERVLSAEQIELIKNWVDSGCLPGDTSKIKSPEGSLPLAMPMKSKSLR